MGTSTVAAVMTQPVVTALPGETLHAAAERMRSHGIGSLVVVEGNRPVGIITERDLLRATAAAADPAATAVADWMVAEVECVHPDATVDQAWQQLADHGYRHIPVVVGGELKGIVSLRDLVALARLRPADELAVAAPPGLKGVVVAETALGDVRGTEGFYHYRQYAAPDLARTRTFEDVWHLLVDGELPATVEERSAFAADVAPLRELPAAVLDALPGIARGVATPVAGLRTGLSLLAGVEGFAPSLDVDRAQLRADALRLTAATPTIIAALHRLRQGAEPVAPRPDLGHAANYLHMLSGVDADPRHVRAIEQYLILGIDHGFNASTFVARAVTSTGADLGAAVVAALGSLSGPLHGGSPSRALDTLDAIGSPGNAATWVRDAVAGGQRIMGFGHAVYRTADPRSELLRGVVEDIGGELGRFAIQVEGEVERTLAELKPDRVLRTNIEWYAAVTMDRCGLPRDLFTPTFAASRIVGWCAHALEQHADNRIIRPSSRYVGPPPPHPVPDPAPDVTDAADAAAADDDGDGGSGTASRRLLDWTVLVPVVGVLILAVTWTSKDPAWPVLLVVGACLAGAVPAAVHHAEVVAHRVGEPYGALVLAVAVTVIEVGLIVMLMVTGDADTSTLARDTVFAAVMITCNGILGLSLLVGALRRGTASFNAEGTASALATVLTLATLSLVVPRFTTSEPGPEFSGQQLAFAAVASLALYLLFVFVQTIRHPDIYQPVEAGEDRQARADGEAGGDADLEADGDEADDGHRPTTRDAVVSLGLLFVALVAVVGLAKIETPAIEDAVDAIGAPPSAVGVVIALLVLAPEAATAVRNARRSRMQVSINLALGSAMASIGLTIPAIAIATIWLEGPLVLGLGSTQIVLLAITAVVGALTVLPGRATVQEGGVHLALLAAFLFLAVNP